MSEPEDKPPGEPPAPSDIRPVSILDEMKRSYLDYAMSVIVARALPDARDGLKPVHRRILYSMYEQGHTPDKKYVKSARVVGDVIGKYHPHGDQSIYDAMVRMAQDFSMRVPLIDGQGNFGSVDGDPPAAYRYTEARLTRSALEVLGDIDKDTVDFQANYDNSESEPSVLPAKFPNLLVNGAGGIAVGMATNIPPHNLGEVIDACIALIENPGLGIDDLINIIPGPDFPTGGIILGRQGIRSAYHLGRGSIVMRGKVEIQTIRKDREDGPGGLMNDPFHGANFTAVQPGEASISPTALWPKLTERLTKHKFTHSVLMGRRELPLFCNPLIIFLLNWVLMLVSLSFQITYVSYPAMGMPVLLFALSLGSFLFGYLVARTLLHRWPTHSEPLAYTLDVTRIWQINLLFCVASLLLIGGNWILSGPPPALGDPASYLTYGRFKQVLFPLLVVVTVNSMLDSSRWRRVLFAGFGIAGMALYITRGLLMVTLLQMLFVFSLKTRMSRKKLYSIAAGCLALAIVAITLIGNARTAQGVFLEYLQIRHKYFDWPMAYLWLTSYISIPISNLCWLFAKGNFHGPTLSFLYPLLALISDARQSPCLHSQ